MHKFFLCLRYLRKRRIAFFAIMAVALCVALLIVITSLFSGFIAAFQQYQQRKYGQVVLAPRASIHGHQLLAERLEALDCVASATAVTETAALMNLGRGDVRAVELRGVVPGRENHDAVFSGDLLLQRDQEGRASFELTGEQRAAFAVWWQGKFRRELPEGQMPTGVIVGIGLLAQSDEETGEYDRQSIITQLRQRKEPIYIITGKAAGGATDQNGTAPQKIRKLCWPVNAVQTGVHLEDTHVVYVPFDFVLQLKGQRDRQGRMEGDATFLINGATAGDTDKVVEQVRREWRTFARGELNWKQEWIDWAYISASAQTERVRSVTREIRKQMAIVQLMVGVICLVAALLVFVILFMIVMQKRRDIGIMRAVGSSRAAVAAVFVGYGGAVGLAGAALGLGLGAWATNNISLIEGVMTKLLGFKMWHGEVYIFSEIPNEVAWESVGWILATGILTAMIGALLPAWQAARLEPVEALRYE